MDVYSNCCNQPLMKRVLRTKIKAELVLQREVFILHVVLSTPFLGTTFKLQSARVLPKESAYPSPVSAQQDWMCQSWSFMVCNDRALDISAAVRAPFKSCLFANIKMIDWLRFYSTKKKEVTHTQLRDEQTSFCSMRNNSSFTTASLSLSVLSITMITA